MGKEQQLVLKKILKKTKFSTKKLSELIASKSFNFTRGSDNHVKNTSVMQPRTVPSPCKCRGQDDTKLLSVSPSGRVEPRLC